MATRIELAEMVCALLNSTRKGEGWVVTNDDYRRQTSITSNTKQVVVDIRAARDARNGDQRVKVGTRYIGALQHHAPRYAARAGMVRGWKPKTLLLRRDATALALAVLSYVTTTAIAGLADATARRDEAERVRAAEEAARIARENVTDELSRELLMLAPRGSTLRTRSWNDPRGAGVNLGFGVIRMNERYDNADGGIEANLHLENLTPAQLRAIVIALRQEAESRLSPV